MQKSDLVMAIDVAMAVGAVDASVLKRQSRTIPNNPEQPRKTPQLSQILGVGSNPVYSYDVFALT